MLHQISIAQDLHMHSQAENNEHRCECIIMCTDMNCSRNIKQALVPGLPVLGEFTRAHLALSACQPFRFCSLSRTSLTVELIGTCTDSRYGGTPGLVRFCSRSRVISGTCLNSPLPLRCLLGDDRAEPWLRNGNSRERCIKLEMAMGHGT